MQDSHSPTRSLVGLARPQWPLGDKKRLGPTTSPFGAGLTASSIFKKSPFGTPNKLGSARMHFSQLICSYWPLDFDVSFVAQTRLPLLCVRRRRNLKFTMKPTTLPLSASQTSCQINRKRRRSLICCFSSSSRFVQNLSHQNRLERRVQP